MTLWNYRPKMTIGDIATAVTQPKARRGMTNAELEKIFTYHEPKGDQPANYVAIRNHAMHFAFMINDICPESREKSLALTSLQQTVQWANAAIAIHQ